MSSCWVEPSGWRIDSTARPTPKGGTIVANSEPSNQAGPTDADPRPASVAIVTTEHFTLQGARSSTIAESTGRASMFLGAVTGGLVALGFRTYARPPSPANLRRDRLVD
jgi:hypothetical protein